MTVIMGLNLSDRICLIADSRVSNQDPQTKVVTVRHDNMLKIEPLDSLLGCVIASAGDAKFAQFIIKGINRDFHNKSVAELRDGIEEWANRQGEIYGETKRDSLVNFLIAGVAQNTKKKINLAKFNAVLDAFFNGKPGHGSMRNILVEALSHLREGDKELVVGVNDTILFSLQIDLQKGVCIKDSEWGEMLISGPSQIDKESIEYEAIGRLEFEQTDFTSIEDAIEHDIILQTAIASSLVSKHDWMTVGGSYVPLVLLSNAKLATLPRQVYSSTLDGDDFQFVSAFQIEGNNFYRLDQKGTKYRLEKVSEVRYGKKGIGDAKLLI